MSVAIMDQFVNEYIQAWSTTDLAQRKQLINKLYAEAIDFYANEPGDGPVERHGLTGILENITQVNQRLTQGQRLVTESTGYSLNHDALKVTWQMKTPEGQVAMTGMNLLLLDALGKIVRDYIFIG